MESDVAGYLMWMSFSAQTFFIQPEGATRPSNGGNIAVVIQILKNNIRQTVAFLSFNGDIYYIIIDQTRAIPSP